MSPSKKLQQQSIWTTNYLHRNIAFCKSQWPVVSSVRYSENTYCNYWQNDVCTRSILASGFNGFEMSDCNFFRFASLFASDWKVIGACRLFEYCKWKREQLLCKWHSYENQNIHKITIVLFCLHCCSLWSMTIVRLNGKWVVSSLTVSCNFLMYLQRITQDYISHHSKQCSINFVQKQHKIFSYPCVPRSKYFQRKLNSSSFFGSSLNWK